MTDMLDEMIRAAERSIASGYYNVDNLPLEGPGLTAALTYGKSFPVIAEVKMASPSRGRLCPHHPEDLIRAYLAGGAAALSVLTEPYHFLGSMGTLRDAAMTGAPVLMKDFIISEEQLQAAVRAGAGSVLLIQEVFRALPARRRDELIFGAHELGLEVLLEAGSERALVEALDSEADVLGINQRDLRTFEVDGRKGERLLPLALSTSRPVVVMSGLQSRRDIENVRDLGGSGVLIGSAISSSPDPVLALRDLVVPR